MVCCGAWILSGEVVYDEYGFRRPFDPLEITWVRSIYFRDLHTGLDTPITGVGFYVNLVSDTPRSTVTLNYGAFYPKQIGVPQHDATNHRAIAKLAYHVTELLDAYGMVLLENDLTDAPNGRLRRGLNLLVGMQYAL